MSTCMKCGSNTTLLIQLGRFDSGAQGYWRGCLHKNSRCSSAVPPPQLTHFSVVTKPLLKWTSHSAIRKQQLTVWTNLPIEHHCGVDRRHQCLSGQSLTWQGKGQTANMITVESYSKGSNGLIWSSFGYFFFFSLIHVEFPLVWSLFFQLCFLCCS